MTLGESEDDFLSKIFAENSIQLILRRVWEIQTGPFSQSLTFLFSLECINTGATFNTATFAATLQNKSNAAMNINNFRRRC